VLTHGNITANTQATMDVLAQDSDWCAFLYLPLAHSFARVVQMGAVYTGGELAYAESLDRDVILRDLQEVAPEVLPSVPRIFEKAHAAITARFSQATGLRKRLIAWAMRVGKDVSALRCDGREPEGLLALQFRLADRLVYSKVKAFFGGNIQYCISGGAPLAPEIGRFFHMLDIPILEGYGLTESTASSFVNRPDHIRFGTVGPPVPGLEVRIAPDGEVMLRGPGLFRRYHNRPEETAEVVDEAGWFATGDIGELDSEGFLRITDRKKHIIVTAGGKNIAPAYIENKLKGSPYISQVMVHGDRRRFLSALVTLNEEEVAAAADALEIDPSDPAAWAASPGLRAALEAHVAQVNQELETYQQVKKIEILPEELTVENGLLTPSLKVRRKEVESRFSELLDSLYAE
jgi:long-chain acyl-CoA synthetase